MPRKKVRPFDFSKLKNLSRQHVDISQALLEHYPQLTGSEELGQSILKVFAEDLDLELQQKLVGMEETSYGEFLDSLTNPCVAVELRADPQEEKILLDLDYRFARLLIHRLFGETGEVPQDLLPLTPTEQGVLEFLLVMALNQVKEANGIMGPVHFRMVQMVQEGKLMADPHLSKQSGIVFKVFLGLGKQGGYLRIYFPHPLVEGLFLRENVLEGVIRPGEEDLLEKRLHRASHVKASLWSEVGRVGLMPAEKEALEKGDVILFDETFAALGPHGLSGKAVLRVGENPAEGLLAEVIDSEGKLVVKILDYYGGE